MCESIFKSIDKVTQRYVKHVLCVKRYENCKDSIKSMKKYEDKLYIQEAEWKVIYTMPKSVIVDNRVLELQFKLLHRIIATNKFLYKIQKIESPRCHNRAMFIETIEHLFYECMIVRNFWLNITGMWNMYFSKNVTFTCKDIMVGYNLNNLEEHVCENILILYVKHYIYVCKLGERLPQISSFAKYIQSKVGIVLKTDCTNRTDYEQLFEFITECM